MIDLVYLVIKGLLIRWSAHDSMSVFGQFIVSPWITTWFILHHVRASFAIGSDCNYRLHTRRRRILVWIPRAIKRKSLTSRWWLNIFFIALAKSEKKIERQTLMMETRFPLFGYLIASVASDEALKTCRTWKRSFRLRFDFLYHLRSAARYCWNWNLSYRGWRF